MISRYHLNDIEYITQQIILTLELKPNFDIFLLYKRLGIQVIPCKELQGQNNFVFPEREYGFCVEDNIYTLYYVDKSIEDQEYINSLYDKNFYNNKNWTKAECIQFYQRDLRFILATALGDLFLYLKLPEEKLLSTEKRHIFEYNEKKLICTRGRAVNKCLEIFAVSLLLPELDLKNASEKLYWDILDQEGNIDSYNQYISRLCDQFGTTYVPTIKRVRELLR